MKRSIYSNLALFGLIALLSLILSTDLCAQGRRRSRHRDNTETTESAEDWGNNAPQSDDNAPPHPGDDGDRSQPDNPADWGAPGHPGTPENFGFSPEEEDNSFSPQKKDDQSLEEKFEQAGPTDPITLGGDGQFFTEDRVQLGGLFFKGSANKTTIPVILLHDKQSEGKVLTDLAVKLAESGMAVLVPDLRGHGQSKKSWLFDFSPGGNRPAVREKDDYTFEQFTDADIEGLRVYDGLLWYQFLVALHNQGKLNIRRLTIVGVGFGAQVGAAWMTNDWQEPAKRGRFAKHLIAISPEDDGYTFNKLGEIKSKPLINGMVVVGNLDETALKTAETVQLALGHEKPDIPAKDRRYAMISIKTEKEGTELLGVSSFKIADEILLFIQDADSALPLSATKWAAIKTE